jgi:hypothetical protein
MKQKYMQRQMDMMRRMYRGAGLGAAYVRSCAMVAMWMLGFKVKQDCDLMYTEDENMRERRVVVTGLECDCLAGPISQ